MMKRSILWAALVSGMLVLVPALARAQSSAAPNATSVPQPGIPSLALLEGILAAPGQGQIPLVPQSPRSKAPQRPPAIEPVAPARRFYYIDPPSEPARSELFEAARQAARAQAGRSLDLTERLRKMESR